MQVWKQAGRIVKTHRDWLAFPGSVNYGKVIGSRAAIEKDHERCMDMNGAYVFSIILLVAGTVAISL